MRVGWKLVSKVVWDMNVLANSIQFFTTRIGYYVCFPLQVLLMAQHADMAFVYSVSINTVFVFFLLHFSICFPERPIDNGLRRGT